jgi:hypothetical protein
MKKKKTLMAFALVLVSVSAYAAKDQFDACRTDGCVMQRHSETDAAYKWLREQDECSSVVSYILSLERVGDSTFRAVCGDVHDRTTILFRVDSEWGDNGLQHEVQPLPNK